MAPSTPWNFEAEYIQSCNCDYGCPCNFNGLPTFGNCEALIAFHLTKGSFDRTPLGGVTFAAAYWWPKAIHQGNGTGRLYIDPSATKDQQKAIAEIASGKHGGGVFEIFPKTLAKVYPIRVTPIEFEYKDYDSWFRVEGVGEVHSEHIRNPVTHDPFEGSISLPGGIIFKKGLVTSIKRWWMRDEELLAFHEARNGHVARVKFSEQGCLA
ncbi:MAG TPA: DUF1326 domain-containing protein [Thermoplasmata archaeon]|nr:DUF1326 domain-containing protein [Thermoplasmata archaeon]